MLAPLLLAAALQAPAASPAPPAPAQGALPPGSIAIAQARIEAAMEKLGVPGVAVAVVAREQLVWSAAFGEADVENDVPVRTDTMFRLASVSKPITATAVLQLVERGRLDLDAPVQRYVPSFPDKPWPVTPRLLLAHLGGVRHYREGEFSSTRRYAGATDALHIFAADPLAHEPGTRFLYTSYGYNLLGCAVEGASGQSFLDYVRANVFEPAATTTRSPSSRTARRATRRVPPASCGTRRWPTPATRCRAAACARRSRTWPASRWPSRAECC
jgi:CubicO group peptidase (beta-lactamase class C family)